MHLEFKSGGSSIKQHKAFGLSQVSYCCSLTRTLLLDAGSEY